MFLNLLLLYFPSLENTSPIYKSNSWMYLRIKASDVWF